MTHTDKSVSLSVVTLVQFVLRAGDIKSGFVSRDRMREGSKIHEKIQNLRKAQTAEMGLGYTPELPLSAVVSFLDFSFHISGRADSVITRDESVSKDKDAALTDRTSFFADMTFPVIEELKSISTPIAEITAPDNTHFAQAALYGYMYCEKHNLPGITVAVTYIACETMEEKSYAESLTRAALTEFVHNLLERYYPFAKTHHEHFTAFRGTAQTVKFPYPAYRPRQREFMAWVYKAVKQGKKLYCQAPTGTGKTISTIFPGVKACGEGYISKIFYLTAKGTTGAAAEEAVSALRDKGCEIRAITLTGKEKICIKQHAQGGMKTRPVCNAESCKYAKGHFDRVNEALLSICKEPRITNTVLWEYAEAHTVCPHELSLDAAIFCDIIICDYNYVYDPAVRLRRFFNPGEKNDFLALIDEAHNLPDRAMEMYSAALSLNDFKNVRGIIAENSELNKRILVLEAYFDTYQPLNTNLPEIPKEILSHLEKFILSADKWLGANQSAADFNRLLELYFTCLSFLRAADEFDARYTYIASNKDLKILCLDPSYQLNQCGQMVVSSVFFSATLTPINYFREILGGEEQDYCIMAQSPFEPSNLCCIIQNDISVKYKNRPACFEPVCRSIHSFISAKNGNYLVFFPSYAFLSGVSEIFKKQYQDIKIITQERNQSHSERDAFLENFSAENTDTLVGFAVLGGVFGESVDLLGGRLIGAVLVGVGLPLITYERDLIARYYDSHKGFLYAYTYPGMNKVLQAAGRVIRHEDDKGALLFIDERFTGPDYIHLFPPHMSHYQICKKDDIFPFVKTFWAGV